MKHNDHNRMATPTTRDRTPVPVERVLVTPPPESVVKCPHCGAARIGQWVTIGTWPGTTEIRKQCKACGVKVRMSNDFRSMIVVG